MVMYSTIVAPCCIQTNGGWQGNGEGEQRAGNKVYKIYKTWHSRGRREKQWVSEIYIQKRGMDRRRNRQCHYSVIATIKYCAIQREQKKEQAVSLQCDSHH